MSGHGYELLEVIEVIVGLVGAGGEDQAGRTFGHTLDPAPNGRRKVEGLVWRVEEEGVALLAVVDVNLHFAMKTADELLETEVSVVTTGDPSRKVCKPVGPRNLERN